MRKLPLILAFATLFITYFSGEILAEEKAVTAINHSNSITSSIDIHQQAASIKKSLSAGASYNVKLNLSAGDFVRGQLESNLPLADFSLLDENNKQVKQLINLSRNSGRFLFTVPKSGQYYLLLQANSSATQIKISINKAISKTEQKSASVLKVRLLSPRLNQLRQTITKGQSTDKFWQQVIAQGTPMVEVQDENNSIVTFLWRGAKNNVRLFGAPYDGHKELTRLENSDVWYTSYIMPNTSRISYQLAPDVPQLPGTKQQQKVAVLATAQQDPYNKSPLLPYENADKYQSRSILVLSKAPEQKWQASYAKQKGSIKNYRFSSKLLNNTRDISIYTPANYNVDDKEQALLFVFDGNAYQTKVPTPQILDNLIAAKKIPPTIAVFIDNPSRSARSNELPPNTRFADFIAKELLPFVKGKTDSRSSSYNTILTGSSYGGLASSYVAFQYPELFGTVLSQSASFWWSPKKPSGEREEAQWLTREYAKAKVKPIRFYFSAGIFESGYMPVDILESNRHFRDILMAKGYRYVYQEVAGGHNYVNWRGGLAQGLIALFADEPER